MWRLSSRVHWGCIAVLLLLFAAYQAAPARAAEKTPPRFTDEQLSQILARPVNEEFKQTPLEEVVQRFEKLLGIPFYLDRKALQDARVSPDEPITEKFRGTSAESALSLVLRRRGLYGCPFGQELILVTTAEQAELEVVTRVYDVRDLLHTKDEYGREIRDVEWFARFIQSKIQPVPSWHPSGGVAGYQAPGLEALVVCHSWSMQQEVKRLLSDLRALRHAGPEPRRAAGKQSSTPLPEAIRPPKKTSDTTPGEDKVMAGLGRRISFRLEQATLDEVAQTLARQLAVPVVLDRRSDAAGIKVTTAHRDARGEAVLDLLARQYDLDWSIRDDAIFLATAKTAPRVVKSYDVRDLAARRTKDGAIVYRADELVDAIRTTLYSGSWERPPRKAKIELSPDQAAIVVTQTWRVQRAVADFLQRSRAARPEGAIEIPEGSRFSPSDAPTMDDLLKALDSNDDRYEALAHLEKMGLDAAPAVPRLVRLLDQRDDHLACQVIETLGAIGKDAAPAIPKLIQRLTERELPRISAEGVVNAPGVRAAMALGKMGQYPVPLLIQTLSHGRLPARSNAAFSLLLIGPRAKEAVPALVAQLRDPDCSVRECAAEAIGMIHSEPGVAVPALITTLRDENFNVRRFAAVALGRFRPTTPSAIEALIGALDDKNGDVQHASAEALGGLGPEAAAAVPALAKMLKSQNSFHYGHPGQLRPVAGTAARALGSIGPPAKIATPALLELIADTEGTYVQFTGCETSNDEARGDAAVAAARIAPHSPALLQALARALTVDHKIRNKVAQALAIIGPEAKDLVPLLLKFASADSWYHSQCAIAAAIIAPDAKGMPELLIKQLPPESEVSDDDDWKMLITALQKGPARLHAAIPLLIEIVMDRSSDPGNAARALAVFGRDAETAVPALLDLLQDPWEHPRQEAIAALVRVASEQSPPLLAARKSKNPHIRSGVVEVLGHFPAGLPLVIESLADPSARVRLAAINTLARLGPAAKSAIPELRKQLASDSRTLSEAAEEALLKIEGQ